MAFPSGAITLTQITDAYGLQRNMNALRGKIYSNTSGNTITIPSSGEIGMGQFRGGIVGISYALPAKSATASAINGTFGLNLEVGFKNTTYVMNGSKLISLTVTCYGAITTTEVAVSKTEIDPSAYIRVDGQVIYVNMDIPTTITLSATSALEIYVQRDVRVYNANNVGVYAVKRVSWQYNITSSGLQPI